MSEVMRMSREERIERAQQLVERLPLPVYTKNYQVEYEHEDLVEAMAENLSTTGVARPNEIDDLSDDIAAVTTGKSDRPIIITNSCAEDIDVTQPIDELAQKTIDELQVVKSSMLNNPVVIQRMCGQFFKPRTSMTEMIDGTEVLSYMGDGINGRDAEDRVPDASRLVAGALQSRDIQEHLIEETGSPVLTAHEALSLAYEIPFIREDPETGKKYLHSAHLPWIGMRTNQVGGPHINMLSKIENTVGVKIGPKSDEGHIADIAKTLNPNGLPGKIAFMVRMGLNDRGAVKTVLRGIKRHAPDAAVLYDIHGSTRKRSDGKKIRLVSEIVAAIDLLAYESDAAGLRLNGVHLETMNEKGRLECIDHIDETPLEGNVDPRLNPNQTAYILNTVVPFINR
jgi:3-deoxy-7-phosphoheptulonate synthase